MSLSLSAYTICSSYIIYTYLLHIYIYIYTLLGTSMSPFKGPFQWTIFPTSHLVGYVTFLETCEPLGVEASHRFPGGVVGTSPFCFKLVTTTLRRLGRQVLWMETLVWVWCVKLKGWKQPFLVGCWQMKCNLGRWDVCFWIEIID